MQDSKRDTDVRNRFLDYVGVGECGMIWENSTETYITVCKIEDQYKFDTWSRALKAGALGQPRGVGREVGGGFRVGGHMCTYGRFMSVYGKNRRNIVK